MAFKGTEPIRTKIALDNKIIQHVSQLSQKTVIQIQQ